MLRKIYLSFLALCLMLPVGAPAEAVDDAPWQIAIYMVTADMEDKGIASADLEEMTRATQACAQMELYVCTGGSQAYPTCTIWHIADGSRTVIKELGEINMGQSSTLQSFLAAIPLHSGRKALILWDHGRPLIGLGKDMLFHGDALNPLELQESLSNGPLWDLIAFDACMMASAETATALQHHARYAVFSQEPVQQQGFNYEQILPLLMQAQNGGEAGQSLCDAYQQDLQKRYEDFPEQTPIYSLSCIRLDAMPAIQEAAEPFFQQLANGIQLGSYPSASRIREETYQPGRFSIPTQYDQLDLHDWCQRYQSLLPDESTTLQAALEGAVIANVANHKGLNGLSVYFPVENQTLYREHGAVASALYLCPSFETFSSLYLEQRHQKQAYLPLPNSIQAKDDQTYTYQLSPELQAIFLRGAAFLYRRDHEKQYALVRTQKQLMADQNGLISYTFQDEAVYLCDPHSGEMALIPLYDIQHESDDLTRANSLVILVSSQLKLIQARMNFVISGNNVHLAGLNENDEYATGKSTLQLEDFIEIYISGGGFIPTYTPEGTVRPFLEWKGGSRMDVHILPLKDVQLMLAPYPEEDWLYLQFQLLDIYGDVHASELIRIH